MQDFDYLSGSTVAEVVTLLRDARDAQLLSGGTDLIVQLREGRKQAGLVVDIKKIPELNELCLDKNGALRIGAAVPCNRFVGDPLVVKQFPGLVDAVSLIGGTQIQSRASIGGNLCNASPAADTIPALIVHRAVCEIAGPEGFRDLPVESFCTSPGRNALAQGEFLVAIRVPPLPASFGAAYLRFIPRNEMDIAVTGAGASVVLDEEKSRFISGRVALGAVAPTPLFVEQVGRFLEGKAVSPAVILAAAQIARSAANPISDMRGTAEQRRHLTLVLTKRALSIAVERAKAA